MTITTHVRTLLETLLNRRGLTIHSQDQPPRGFADFLAMYRRLGPRPATVFDIGVGRGTPWLYEAFPDSHLVLIEPLRDFAPHIDSILQTYKGECHYCALAETDGELRLHVPIDGATGSSLLPRDPDWAAHKVNTGDKGTVERIVPVARLDALAADTPGGGHVVKIDVEGAELRVMRGGSRCVAAADMLIVECAIAPRHSGESDFVDIAHHLKSEGFSAGRHRRDVHLRPAPHAGLCRCRLHPSRQSVSGECEAALLTA